jgi:hypothetical protein
MAKCPYCEATVTHVDIKSVALINDKLNQWTGLSYSCPECDRILSIGFDSVALNADLLKSVVTSVVNSLRNS